MQEYKSDTLKASLLFLKAINKKDTNWYDNARDIEDRYTR